MSLTRTRSEFLGMRLLGLAPLLLLALSPAFGCGDTQVASKPQLNPPKMDGGPGRGGQGGNVTGTAGMGGGGGGGSSGSGGASGTDGGLSPDAPASTSPDDGGSVADAPPAPDTAPEPDTAPPDTAPPACVVNMPCTVGAGGNGLCRAGNPACVACNGQPDDAACVRAYGANAICAMGRCVVQNCATSRNCPMGQLCETGARICQACTADAQCKADAVYGAATLCINGRCATADCRVSTDCAQGKICGVGGRANLCSNCQNSQQCAADPRYRDHVCVQTSCVPGDCLTSDQCNGAKNGLICGVMAPNRCGTCTADAQCAGDPKYGAQRPTCFVGEGADKGKCVSNACMAVNQRCPQNPASFCCARGGGQNACVAGDCCNDMQCQGGQRCVSNKCTIVGFGCDGPMGNAIFVDPVNGADNSTGSGRSGAVLRADCAFRTLSRALQAARSGAINNGTITIIGNGAMTELKTMGGSAADPVEGLPITVPANVTITTRGGPILLRLTQPGVAGFQIEGASTLAPLSDAPINIDGLDNMGGSGIVVATQGTVRLQNVAIRNTGDHGIKITSGTVQVGSGIQVSGAGTAAAVRSGLNVSGGTAQIQVNGMQPGTAFSGNSGAGISVRGTGGLEVTGATAANLAQSSVVVSNNRTGAAEPAGVFIQQDAGANSVVLAGIAVFNHPAGAGIKVGGGSRLTLRRSVVLDNQGAGVLLSAVAANQDFAQVNLGRAGEPGLNILQSTGGLANGGGICFSDLATPLIATIPAQGNTFAGPLDCRVPNGMAKVVRVGAQCMGGVDLAIPADQPMLTVDVAICTLPAPPAVP